MKFRLEVIERGIVFAYISGFPDELRGKGKLFGKDGFEVQSVSVPALGSNCIYLPGTDREDDHRLAALSFPSHVDAVAYWEKVLDALTAWWREYRGEEGKAAGGVIDLEELI